MCLKTKKSHTSVYLSMVSVCQWLSGQPESWSCFNLAGVNTEEAVGSSSQTWEIFTRGDDEPLL